MELIGRADEQRVLKDLLHSEQAEFLAIYGRRRIGKTYLIKEYFKSNPKALFFNVTGSKDASLITQINHFTAEISRVFYNNAPLQVGKNWDETFKVLTGALANLPKKQKIVLFFDEFPWFATKNSKILTTLDYYWNQYWSGDHRIKLIICGSSASWIVEKILNNKGGLHNRITKKICLEPFSLDETKEFLESKGIKLTHTQIVQLYMVMGGVPYYLTQLKKGLSAMQNIHALAFKKDGILTTEFDNLFAALFEKHEICIDLIRLIAKNPQGAAQEMILDILWAGNKGEEGLKKLKELEASGFIKRFKPYLHKKKGIYYKLIDEYTCFYLSWIEPLRDKLVNHILVEEHWELLQNSPQWYAWAGCAFEAVCFKHIPNIQKALHIGATAFAATWKETSQVEGKSGAQIDLLFDRFDDAITLCEIKFTKQPFSIDKTYADNLKNKITVFKRVTRTKKQIFFAMICAEGLRSSKHSKSLISRVVSIDDLFKKCS